MPTSRSSTASAQTTYAFPGGRLDPAANELRIGDRVHRLEPRHVEALRCLLANAGTVVGKETLLHEVWQDRHVTDDVLATAIYQLRRALGDRARSPRFIETIARRGYRWIAQPVVREDNVHPAVTTTPGAHPPRAAAGVSGAATDDSGPRPRAALAREAGGFKWRVPLAAGLALAVLVVGGLTHRPPSFGNGGDVTAVPPPIALDEVRTLITDRTPSALARARTILGWRLGDQPDDIEALALDARAAAFAAELAPQDRPRLIREARRAADRARALAPQNLDTLLTHGLVALLHERDPRTARRALVEAYRRAPDDPEVLQAVSWWLSISGKHQAALAAARASVARDPGATTRWTDYAFLARSAGDPAQAVRATGIALDLTPRAGYAATLRLWSRRALDQPHQAVEEFLAFLMRCEVSSTVRDRLREAFDDGGFEAFHHAYLEVWGAALGPLDHAVAALFDDDPHTAIEHLAIAVARGDPETLWLDSLPELAPLRRHPRFAHLRAELGLASTLPAGGSGTLLGRLHPGEVQSAITTAAQ